VEIPIDPRIREQGGEMEIVFEGRGKSKWMHTDRFASRDSLKQKTAATSGR
jgi:hypothetical protein